MSFKVATSRGKRKRYASQSAFHAAEISETARTTGMLTAAEHRQWALARAAQLADCARRRRAEQLFVIEHRPTADELLLARWDALQAAVREAA